jgi:CRISPR-associated protein Cmr6
MRHVLHHIGTPDHVSLAYGAWGPVGDDGKVPDAERSKWLTNLASISVAPDYTRSFERWKKSFSAAGDRLAELTLASRLLVGHGNSSAIDVGITVHHTWGVPVIPGSALKGLVAHYVDATYGPNEPDKKPWEQQGDERTRASYQGVTWSGPRIDRGPGAVYRALFGAPDAREDDAMREHGVEAGASAGLVTFHDAIYVPNSIADDKPFAADVLTVHQKDYYDSSGKSAPNDYDSPNPVAFVTVRPKCRLLLALSGPGEWTELAGQLLKDALEKWGVGSKTSAGYGFGTVGVWRQPELRASKALGEFEAWLADEANAAVPQRQRLTEIGERWLPKLMSLSNEERQRAANAMKRVIKSPKLTTERDKAVAQLTEGRVP